MTPAAIIKNALADGVKLALSLEGTIKVAGNDRAVNRWLPLIKTHKADLIAALEDFEERAAIMEFDGRLNRPAAEHAAHHLVFCRDCVHHLPQPDMTSRSGNARATPSGCDLGLITPKSWPPIYSFTGWCCSRYLAANGVSAINADTNKEIHNEMRNDL